MEDAGYMFVITYEKIRLIEANALCKLKNPSRSLRLCEYITN